MRSNSWHRVGAATLAAMIGGPLAVAGFSPSAPTPGTGGPAQVVHFGSILPIVNENGQISLSQNAIGSNDVAGADVVIVKPNGAIVRKAFLSAATTGGIGATLSAGDITIDGAGVTFTVSTPSAISSNNYFGDVTSLVQAKLDAAAAGPVSFHITEADTLAVDGVILSVIFDDPNQTQNNTIALLFGAQNVAGDTFNIGLATPLDKSDPSLKLELGLGISFSFQFQGVQQFSTVDVNGQRLSSAAGGEDDGQSENGALITVGGVGDSDSNPSDPNATPNSTDGARSDDELYDLLPFVQTGDTTIQVDTVNPSTDDNIFYASLVLPTAVVGEGIVLAPIDATNPLGVPHAVTATLQDDEGQPIVGRTVTFTVIEGPNAGLADTGITGSDGKASFTYTSTLAGVDQIRGSFVSSSGQTVLSNVVRKEWISSSANLTLTKTVDNTGGGTAAATDWTLSATGPTTISGITGSPAVTNAVVSAGTYTLAESGPSGYTATNWSCTDGTLTGSSLVLAAGDTATCSITNVFSGTASADLSITKADAPDPVTVGSELTYTLTVNNAGPDSAADVTATDALPATVAFVSAVPSQGTCAGTATVSCSLGTINAGGSATVTIKVTPTSDADLSNTASVSSTTSDSNSTNNSDTELTTVDAAPPTDTNASGTKYYDANANGQLDAGEVGLADWPIDYDDGTTSALVVTDAAGNFSVDLAPGTYTFAERQAGSPWFQTGNTVDQSGGTGDVTLNLDMTYTVSLDVGETAIGLNFGNLCVGADGGRTIGFWGNRNGQALIGADDLALLSGLNLVNEDGSAFDPTTAAEVRTWLRAATARNMAYMLSAQLASMALNVHNGFVDGSSLVYAPGTTSANVAGFATVDALMAEANAELGLHPTTVPGDTWLDYQTALKDALDTANNNLTFVQADPSTCPAPFAD